MDQFVCVRVVQAWGMDLSLFQFDWQATWMVFLMNSERVIYGRYGRSSENTVEGLRTALEGALELHKNYPANKAELEGKAGTSLPWKTPEALPAIQEKGKYREAESKGGCIHCHNVLSGVTKSFRAAGQAVPERFAAPYPAPERMGVSLDTKERATVTSVTAGSPAEKGGLQRGDKILRLGGQPILSIADVQWVLFSGPGSGPLKVEFDRAGQKLDAMVTLPPGWRTR